MATVTARSPVLRVLRNLTLLWAGLSLLALLGAVAFVVYAMGWGCQAGTILRGGLSWGGCVGATLVSIFAAIASLVTALVALIFVQLFYLAGVDVRTGQRRRVTLREAVLNKAADEVVDEALDAVDVGDILD